MKTIMEGRIEDDLLWLQELSQKHPRLSDRITRVVAKINGIKPTVNMPVTPQRQREEIKIHQELCIIGVVLISVHDPQNERIARIMGDIMAPIF